MWVVAVLATVAFLVELYYGPPLGISVSQKPGKFDVPSAEDGGTIPVVFGTVLLKSPNVVWSGDYEAAPFKEGDTEEITVLSEPLIGSRATLGYRYYARLLMAICHGKIDGIRRISVGKKVVWSRMTTTGASLDLPYLFGGLKGGGGLTGGVGLSLGEKAAPGANAGVTSTVNTKTINGPGPGNYGIATIRLLGGSGIYGFYFGTSPVLQPWEFTTQRIHFRNGGDAQWYDAKAEISVGKGREDVWKYFVGSLGVDIVNDLIAVDYDDSAWATGAGGFGNTGSTGLPVANDVTVPRSQTTVSAGSGTLGKSIWLRHNFGPMPVTPLMVEAWHDDGGDLWFNGTKVGTPDVNALNPFLSIVTIPASLINPKGPNVIAYRTVNGYKNGEMSGTNSHIYAGLAVGSRYAEAIEGDEVDSPITIADMNPAHIIRECLTDATWGMGYAEGDIDDVSFMAAADTLYAEQLGISIAWSEQTSIADFIHEIKRHINGELIVDPTTGKFKLKLIRADYNVANLITLDDTSIIGIDNVVKKSIGDLVNSVTAGYTNALTGNGDSVTVFDPGLVQTQGSIISTRIDYPGFTTQGTVTRAATRDLRTLSYPGWSCTIEASRKAASLTEGDVFILQQPNFGISSMVMRVAAIDLGDGISNKVKISAIEDMFTLPSFAAMPANGGSWTDPSDAPLTPGLLVAQEAPYPVLCGLFGQANVDTTLTGRPTAGYSQVAMQRTSGALNADLLTRLLPASTASAVLSFDMCPYCTVTFPVWTKTSSRHPITFTYAAAVRIDAVALGSYAVLVAGSVSEVVRVDAIDTVAGTVTFGRGCFDTVPIRLDGVTCDVFFLQSAFATDNREYLSGNQVGFSARTKNSTKTSDIGTEHIVTFAQRALRPYPPGYFRINGAIDAWTIGRTGDTVLTWRHRDRKLQLGSTITDTTGSSIGPEAGTTYTLVIKNETGTAIRTVTGLTAETYTYTNGVELYDLDTLSDPYYSNTVALLHLNTDWADDTGKTWGTGSASISTAQKVFGAGSALGAGTDARYGADGADWNFGTGDFTVECRVRINAYPPSGWYMSPLGNYISANGWCIFASSTGTLHFNANAAGYTSTGTTLALNTWYAIAVTRIAGIIRIFVDGVLTYTSGATSINLASTLCPRICSNAVSSDGWRGHVDEVRITKGVGRYSSTYTPLSVEFTLSAPNAQLQHKLSFVLSSTRGGLDSFTQHDILVLRPGWGGNFGSFFGGTT